MHAPPAPADARAELPPVALTPVEESFALEYLANGFNATRAYKAGHPNAGTNTCAVEGHRILRSPKVAAWLRDKLEEAWKPLQMGGEQALARVAQIASFDIRDLYDEKGELLKVHLWPDNVVGVVRGVQDGPYGLKVSLESPHTALRTILEQTGKLKTLPDSIDALAEALRQDTEAHAAAMATLPR